MFKHRCPWCGEEIGFPLNIIEQAKYAVNAGYTKGSRLHWSMRCPFCKQKIHNRLDGAIMSIFMMIYVFLPQRLYNASAPWLWLCFFFLLWVLFIDQTTPLQREAEKPDRSSTCAKVKILWKPRSEKGLFKPRWQVLNGEIFPAYFFRDGKLVSSAWCVTIKNIHWNNSRECDAVISVVLDDAPEVLLKDSDEFKLFYQGREIAIGTDAKT